MLKQCLVGETVAQKASATAAPVEDLVRAVAALGGGAGDRQRLHRKAACPAELNRQSVFTGGRVGEHSRETCHKHKAEVRLR